MIVFDASSLVGVVIKDDSVPALALRRTFMVDALAISAEVSAEYVDVLHRPRLSRFIDPVARTKVLSRVASLAILFRPRVPVTDCRDRKDNKLALESGSSIIVSSDNDLLVLDPWRGVRILKPADCLAFVA